MWHTPVGLRYLQGAEAALLKEAIGLIWDHLEEEIAYPDNPWECGIRIFDGMEGRQKLALLATVSNALFRAEVPEPPLNALHEATVAAIYESFPVSVAIEIDAEDLDWSDSPEVDLRTWRRLILAAFVEDDPPSDYPLPGIECCDQEEWDLLIGCLADYVLWDDDWADEEIMDADPETARKRKRRLGINDDYYLAIAPDPTDGELDMARAILKRLLSDEALT
jgi:hypothetical protein